MKKKIIACLLCVFCLFSIVGCTQSTATQTTVAATEAETADYLSSISGTYVELFPEMAKAAQRCYPTGRSGERGSHNRYVAEYVHG